MQDRFIEPLAMPWRDVAPRCDHVRGQCVRVDDAATVPLGGAPTGGAASAMGVDLGRIVIICCAADAQLARIHLRGPAAAQAAGLADNTWLRVEGEVIAAARKPHSVTIPTLQATAVTRIDAPPNPYDYPR
jgi:hypothetical protein